MRIKSLVAKLLFYLFRVFPIKKNKIVIDNFAGKGFGDNGKYIALELLKRRCDLDIVWLTRDLKEKFPDGIRLVPYVSLKSIYEQVTARVWIDNRRKASYVRKRSGQFYIMTWHGGIGPKKIEKEAENQLGDVYLRSAKNDSKMADLFLAEADFSYKKYKNFFWYNGKILKCGSPRQDILFHAKNGLKAKILQSLGIEEDCHIFLYAPTFRDGMVEKDLIIYRRPWKKILTVLDEQFGGKWIGFIRLHPGLARLDVNHQLVDNNVYDVTSYPDMQELLSISDMVLTDYSSSVYDFGLTGRPGFMLVEDIESYQKQRNLCFGLDVVPFPIAHSDSELIHLLQTFDSNEYKKKLRSFYHDYCGLYPGGNASKTVVDVIENVINGKQ